MSRLLDTFAKRRSLTAARLALEVEGCVVERDATIGDVAAARAARPCAWRSGVALIVVAIPYIFLENPRYCFAASSLRAARSEVSSGQHRERRE